MCPDQLVAAITAIAAALARGRSAGELALMGSAFSQLGDTLSTMAAQKALCQKQ